MVVPLGIAWLLVSLRLPHGEATWKGLIPGALVVAVGFQAAHGMVVWLFGPKLEKSMSLYGGIGLVATVLFFMYVVGRIVVTAPILNSALYEESSRHHHGDRGDEAEAQVLQAESSQAPEDLRQPKQDFEVVNPAAPPAETSESRWLDETGQPRNVQGIA
jgi:uncharacterized BrkB/YihY/UPF0761 family membrane protein